jgi:kynurenine formamidase
LLDLRLLLPTVLSSSARLEVSYAIRQFHCCLRGRAGLLVDCRSASGTSSPEPLFPSGGPDRPYAGQGELGDKIGHTHYFPGRPDSRNLGAAQIPAERLIAPLVVMDLKASSAQISVDDIAEWEAQHGHVPQGAIVAVRRVGPALSPSEQFPVSSDAGQFLMNARCTRGFIVETPASLGSDHMLSHQIALHGNYVVEGSARLTALPETGSIIIVAPEKSRNAAESPVRVLAMVG